jgi:hypothetical protein
VTTVNQHSAEFTPGNIGVVLMNGLGLEVPGHGSTVVDVRERLRLPRLDLLGGAVHWDSIVASGPDWNAMEYEMEWLGI